MPVPNHGERRVRPVWRFLPRPCWHLSFGIDFREPQSSAVVFAALLHIETSLIIDNPTWLLLDQTEARPASMALSFPAAMACLLNFRAAESKADFCLGWRL